MPVFERRIYLDYYRKEVEQQQAEYSKIKNKNKQK